jgi:hypothetical protein
VPTQRTVARAARLPRQSPSGPLITGTLTDAERRSLGGYSLRMPTIALRTGNADLVRPALLALCLCSAPDADDRDVMIQLALHYVVAQRLGLPPADVFGDVADRLPNGWLPALLREFGDRQDITLEAFSWRELRTADGPDFGSIMRG